MTKLTSEPNLSLSPNSISSTTTVSFSFTIGITPAEKSVSEVSIWVDELKHTHPDKKVMMVLNKTDLGATEASSSIQISAKNGENIDVLKSKLVEEVQGDFNLVSDTIVSNARHYDALIKTAEALEKADQGLDSGVTGDFIAMDIRQAMFELGTITGDISTDDLLGNIFSKFCIGK